METWLCIFFGIFFGAIPCFVAVWMIDGAVRSRPALLRRFNTPLGAGVAGTTMLIGGLAFSLTSTPRKIRQLIGDLERAGFKNRGGKGPHRNFEHPRGERVTKSGNLGDDAKPSPEHKVKRAIERSHP